MPQGFARCFTHDDALRRRDQRKVEQSELFDLGGRDAPVSACWTTLSELGFSVLPSARYAGVAGRRVSLDPVPRC